MNQKETMAYIDKIKEYGSVLGLENMVHLLEKLGNPQKDLKFIHVAGTNGKGSTVSFISTVLQRAGYRVGRYVSPVIFKYQERIQINGRSISRKDLAAYMTRIKEAVEENLKLGFAHPTEFEIETALSFLYMKEKGCDLVVLETGLGGRLDATNVIQTPILSVFTSISMDHMAYLGDTLEQIAAEKAGIIKKNCPAVSIRQEQSAETVLRQTCFKRGSSFTIAEPALATNKKATLKKQSFTYKGRQVEISLLGSWQIQNAVLALEACYALRDMGYSISDRALRQGMLEAKWAGRFTILKKRPLFIADGAHNPDAARQLAETIRFYFKNKRIIYIMGVFRDKDYESIIRETYAYASHIITVATPGNPRAMSAYELAGAVKQYHSVVTVADSIQEAVEISYLLAEKEDVILAFGSLSYLGELMTIVEHKDDIKGDTHGKSR